VFLWSKHAEFIPCSLVFLSLSLSLSPNTISGQLEIQFHFSKNRYELISPYLNLLVELELLFFGAESVFLGLGFDGAAITGLGFLCHRG